MYLCITIEKKKKLQLLSHSTMSYTDNFFRNVEHVNSDRE